MMDNNPKASRTLYVSDLDGTLLNANAELSSYTTNALNSMIADGLDFTVATARTLESAGVILADLDLCIPIVLMNGVLIYDLKNRLYVQVYPISAETVSAVSHTLQVLGITGFMYELRDGELMTFYESLEQKPLRDFVDERVARYRKPFKQTNSFADISPEHIIYFTLIDTHDRLKPVHDALVDKPGLNLTLYKDIYNTDLWYLEIFSDKASKQNAVAYLRDAYGYGRIVGFGDNLNDLPMFEACDLKIAVENAKQEVKAAADHICGANNDDGVVKWIGSNVIKNSSP